MYMSTLAMIKVCRKNIISILIITYLNFDYYIPQLIMLLFVLLSQDIGGHLAWAILLLYSCLYIDASWLGS